VSTLFISDLHLDPDEPGGIDWFADFIARRARDAETLYILGDLFEAWIGDDDDDPGKQPVVDALAALTAAGTACLFMHGNRDFLIGERFARATGCRLLPEYETANLYGERVLLTHGDLLCTDDTAYMQLRRTVRDPAWQRDFLAKPLEERRAAAREMRRMSQSAVAGKEEAIMDVNRRSVEQTMRDFGVRLLLHGHTHRPAVHHFDLDGAPAARIVLGAWHEAGTVVRWDEHGYALEPVPRPSSS
jgi:UDP-2,3-diacylglucosamine hydrolase